MSRLTWLFLPCVAFALLLSHPAPAANRIPEDPVTYVPGEILVKYRPTTSVVRRASVERTLDASVLHDFASIGVVHLKLESGTVEDAIRVLRADPGVEYAEPNYVWHALAIPNDERFPELYGLHNTGLNGGTPGADIGAVEAWDRFTGDPEIKIGVIDTGIDYTHPDLADNIWTNEAEANGSPGFDDDGNGYVDDVHGYDFVHNDPDPMDDADISHGTHCSGTIAARGNNVIGVVGVNWRARLVAIKFLDAGGAGSTVGAIQSVLYSIAVGVRLTSNSWGGGAYSQALRDAIRAAGDAGQLFVCAAGNSHVDISRVPTYPPSYGLDNMIAVAATTDQDALASFSNYGGATMVAAPGVSILSTLSHNRYGTLSGTSMATPHVAGAAALIWGQFPLFTRDEVKTLIATTVDPKAHLIGMVTSGGRLDVGRALLQGRDSIPPAGIADLAVTEVGSNRIGLEWTATGDDGASGQARAYDIRHSTAPIDEANYDAATPAAAPAPRAAGSAERFEVSGLAFSTTYYLAVRATDEFGNRGAISNLVSATTLGAPDIDAPAAVSVTMPTGAIRVETMTIENHGPGTLDFSVSPRPPAGVAPTVHHQVSFAKGEEAPVGALIEPERAGGPDAYGYRWADSDAPTGPVFDWIDITGLTAPIPLTGDDRSSDAIPMGIAFPYYGATFDSVHVSTNGFLSFTDPGAPYGDQPLPNPGGVANMIAPFWDDLDFGATPRAYAYGDGSRFIVTWLGVSRFNGGGPFTFQVVLDRGGDILLQYLSLGAESHRSTIGMQDASKTRGATIASNVAYLHDHLAIRFHPPLPPWLAVAPVSGRLQPFGSIDLTLRYDAHALGGDANGEIVISSNDPDEAELIVRALLHADPAPDVTLRPESVDFGPGFVGRPVARAMTVVNEGVRTLNVASVSTTGAGFEVDPAGFALSPGESRFFEVRMRATHLGAHDGILRLECDDPDRPIAESVLLGQGVVEPEISVAPDSLGRTVDSGEQVVDQLTIRNTGGTLLAWQSSTIYELLRSDPDAATPEGRVGSPRASRASRSLPGGTPTTDAAALSPWVVVAPSGAVSANDTGTVPVLFDAHDLDAGEYKAILLLASNDPDRPVVKVRLRLTVFAIPHIAAPGDLDFGIVPLGAFRDLSLQIRNVGHGDLHVTSATITHPAFTMAGLPVTIPRAEAVSLTVRFAPTAECACDADIVLASDDPDQPELHVALRASGAPPARIDLARDTVRAAVAPELGPFAAAAAQTVRLRNSGGYPLDVLLHVVTPVAPSPANGTRDEPLTAAKRPAGAGRETRDAAATEAIGGPDQFGYLFNDSDEPSGPVFDWVDVTGIGTPIDLTGNEGIKIGVPIGFPFPYYGRTFDRVNVNLNGWLSFTSTFPSANLNVRLPDSRAFVPENLLAPFWDDLDFGNARKAYIYQDGQRFIVSWVNVKHEMICRLDCPIGTPQPPGSYTFQLILHPDGTILFQYLDMSALVDNATVGIQNATKNDGLTAVHDGDYVHDHLAVRFEPGWRPPPWVILGTTSAQVGPRDSIDVPLTFLGAGLASGDHPAHLRILTSDPLEPFVEIPVNLHSGVVDLPFEIDPEHHFPRPDRGLVGGRVALGSFCAAGPIDAASVLVGGDLPVVIDVPFEYRDCDAFFGFDRSTLFSILDQGDDVPVDVVGRIGGATWFRGHDSVRMYPPVLRVPAGSLKGGTQVTIDWTDAAGAPPSRYDLWYSEDRGGTWRSLAAGLASHSFSWRVPPSATTQGMLELLAHADADGSFAGAALSVPFRVIRSTTDVGDAIPERFSVRLVGANPVRDDARLEVALAEPGEIDARVYDVRGALVKDLAVGSKEAGRFVLPWNRTDAAGNAVGSGMYFLRVRAGAREALLKLVVAR